MATIKNNPRKTIKVDEFKNYVNDILKNGFGSAEERRGAMFALEHVLFQSGNYRGYRYLRETEVPVGQKAGIHYVVKESNQYSTTYTVNEASFDNTDETRREYQ